MKKVVDEVNETLEVRNKYNFHLNSRFLLKAVSLENDPNWHKFNLFPAKI